jgi:hypothetical protein
MRDANGNYPCYTLGHFDSNQNEVTYKLLDTNNPALGIAVSYLAGDRCANGIARTATISVYCANKKNIVLSAQEPSLCSYDLSMESYYGCPTVSFSILYLFIYFYYLIKFNINIGMSCDIKWIV